MLDCVSFNPKILESKTGINSVTVALNFKPFQQKWSLILQEKDCDKATWF